MSPQQLLTTWCTRTLDSAARDWLMGALAAVAASAQDRELYRAISLAARKLGKQPLALGADDLAQAQQARPGWRPAGWHVDQAARVALLLAAGGDGQTFTRRLDSLCATADVDELVAFYRGLPLYPEPGCHRMRAAEGVRSNMTVVFQAVAHDNPYPAEQFGDDAWNQMVLKALFVGSALAPIAGLDGRANPALATMLVDYAHERWAAGRPISPELWRCVGPFARGSVVDDLLRVVTGGSADERQAARQALAASPDPRAADWLRAHPAEASAAGG